MAGVASLVLASAALTIALIGAARPPVSEYFNAAQNAQEAVRVSELWIAPAVSLLLGLWALAQIVLRRPLLMSYSAARRWPVTNGRIASVSAVAALVVVFALSSMLYGIAAIRAAGPRPITDSMVFSGMCISLGVMSIGGWALSSCLFLRWWQDKHAAAREPVGDLATWPA